MSKKMLVLLTLISTISQDVLLLMTQPYIIRLKTEEVQLSMKLLFEIILKNKNGEYRAQTYRI